MKIRFSQSLRFLLVCGALLWLVIPCGLAQTKLGVSVQLCAVLHGGLSITGAVGTACEVQCVTNLAETNAWLRLTNFTLASNPQLWVDMACPATGRRFYRVVTRGTPVADFTAGPTNSGPAPLIVTFTNFSNDADSYLWDFGDTGTSTEENPVHVYVQVGKFTVTLTAFGPGGTNSLTATNLITVVLVEPPVADFAVSPTNSGFPPLTVQFINLSKNATAYLWDFGDGEISTNVNPVYTYLNPGTYNPVLYAWGVGGQDHTPFPAASTNQITVVAMNLVAQFAGTPTNGPAPLTVTFTNLTTGGATHYFWDFGDARGADVENPTHTYTNNGTYTVTLTALREAPNTDVDQETKFNYIVVTSP
jgi:PKD repeat protein